MNNLHDIIPEENPEYDTLNKQLAAVQVNGRAIQLINNPSEEVQLAAVEQNGYVIYWILKKGIVPSIAVQRAAVLSDPTQALYYMIEYNIPISKMIQWTAAKRIKELDLVVIHKNILDKLDPDVQEYLSNTVNLNDQSHTNNQLHWL